MSAFLAISAVAFATSAVPPRWAQGVRDRDPATELSKADRKWLEVCRETPPKQRAFPVLEQVEWTESADGRPFPRLPSDGNLPEGHIAFTFDDGPDRRATPHIRSILAYCGIRAHFFIVGRRFDEPQGAYATEEILGERDDGHVLGSHSYAHPSFAKQTIRPHLQERELDRGMARLLDISDVPLLIEGRENPPALLFRLPYGDGVYDSNLLALIWGRGLRRLVHVHWNLTSGDTEDIEPKRPGFQGRDAARILKRVWRSLNFSRRDGETLGHGILAMHDTNYRTGLMLPRLINSLVTAGYTFATFDAPPPARAPIDAASAVERRHPEGWAPPAEPVANSVP